MGFWRKFLNLFRRKKPTENFADGKIPSKEQDVGIIIQRLISNAYNDVLVTYDGAPIYDISNDLQRLDSLINSVQAKRASSASRNGYPTKNVNVSASDIRAILWKPIINLPLEHPEMFNRGSIFAIWYENPEDSLEDFWSDIEVVSEIDEYFYATRNRIAVFIDDIMQGSDSDIIDRIIQTIPRSFGQDSV